MTDAPEWTDRRRFLAGASTVAAASLAGCKHNTGGGTKKQAPAFGLSATGIRDIGYPYVNAAVLSPRTVQASGGKTTVIDKEYTYGKTQGVHYPAFVRATPTVGSGSTGPNPVASDSLQSLVRSGPLGIPMLKQLGLLGSGNYRWSSPPTEVDKWQVNLLGLNVPARRFDGKVAPGSQASPKHSVSVGLARLRAMRNNAVLVGVLANNPGEPHVPTDRFKFLVTTAAEGVEKNPPTSVTGAAQAKAPLQDSRLVQTVANTVVEDPSQSNPVHRVSDPELVADEFTAPLFQVGTGKLPKRSYFDVDGSPVNDEFWLERGEVKSGSSGPGAMADVLDTNRRNKPSKDKHPDPFRVTNGTNKVTIRSRAPCGRQLDKTELSKGSDYDVHAQPPMRIGFITCTGQGLWGGNAYGSANTYHDSVANSVQYLRRVFPGGLYAYRYDVPFQGSVDTKPDWMGFARDAWYARNELDAQASSVSLPPNDGRLWAFGGSRSQARQAINNNGFNAWVLIVPSGYFTYHDITGPNGNPPGGLTPSPVNAHNSAVKYNLFAAVSREQAGSSDKWIATTVAHELGHFFGGGKLYKTGVTDEPLAQRDDDGKNDTINGEPVDYAHARYLKSDEDNDGNDDDPGITSVGFDFTGGTYRHVEEYNVNPGSLNIKSSNNSPDDRMESLMSYDGGDIWTDSHLHRAIIRNNWTEKTLAETLFRAVGRVDEGEGDEDGDQEEGLRFDSVTIGPGSPDEDDAEEGTVRVEMRAPDEEQLVSRLVPGTVELNHIAQTVSPVAFEVPFPEQAAAVRVQTEGAEARLNPIVRPIRDAVGRIPDRGFVQEPDGMRSQINELLDQVATLMTDRAYAEANDVLGQLDEFVADVVKEEYDGFGNQPTKEDILLLNERMHERLNVLAEY